MIYDNKIENIQIIYNQQEIGISPNKVLDVDYVNPPDILLNQYQLAHNDGEVTTNSNFGKKSITVKGRINASSKNNLNNEIDRLKLILTPYGKNLDLLVNNQLRRYVASVSKTTYDIYDECSCLYEITFACSGIAEETTPSSLTFGTYTSTNSSYTHSISGTYKSKLNLDCTFSKVFPYWTAKYLEFVNPTLNQRMRLTRMWGLYDRVVIDGKNKAVNLYPTVRTLLNSCDAVANWTSNYTISLDVANQLEGNGALRVDMTGTAGTAQFRNSNGGVTYDFSNTQGLLFIPIFIPTFTSGYFDRVSLYASSDVSMEASNNNYYEWRVTTQYDGSPITYNAWNYFAFNTNPSGAVIGGTPIITSIKSYKIILTRLSGAFQASGILLDYMTWQKANTIPEIMDYEGTFLDIEPGSNSIVVNDEFTGRSIAITGDYYRRYI